VVKYNRLLNNPLEESKRVCDFLGRGDYIKAAKAVNPKLNRSKPIEGEYEGLKKLEKLINNS